MRTYFQAFIR